MADPFAGREDERPSWEGTDPDNCGPILKDLGPLQRAQVVNAINVQIIAELVDLVEELGGEAKLAPGFGKRVSGRSIVCRFLFDDESGHAGGSMRIWSEKLTPEMNHPGTGTRWQRMEGPKREGEWHFYEVIEQDHLWVTLKPITETGEEVTGQLHLTAKADYLRRGVGWRRWVPPNGAIEALGGQEL